MTSGSRDEESTSQQQSSEPVASTSHPETLAPKSAKIDGGSAVLSLRRANTAKKLELLFEAWDANGDGIVDFSDLALGIQKLQPSSEDLHLEYIAESAIAVLVKLETDSNQRLTKQDFKILVDRLTLEMGKPFSVVSEVLLLSSPEVQPLEKSESALLQEIQGRGEEQVKAAQRIATLSQDPRVERLFMCLNRSGSGKITFTELCHMLYKLQLDVSLREARAQAVNTMLLCDTDSARALGRLEFARFLQKLGVMLHSEAGSLAEHLLQLAERGDELLSLDDSATAFSMDTRDPIAQVYETLADRKLHLLFELWDKDGDGCISFAELALGLRKFSGTSEPVTEAAADAAEALLLFDVDSDQNLDRAEFARFVNQFCEACGSDFNTLSEFLILLAALEDNPSEELAFLLSEDKVDRAVADLDDTWRLGINPNPFAKTAAKETAAEAAAPLPLSQDHSTASTASTQVAEPGKQASEASEAETLPGGALHQTAPDIAVGKEARAEPQSQVELLESNTHA